MEDDKLTLVFVQLLVRTAKLSWAEGEVRWFIHPTEAERLGNILSTQIPSIPFVVSSTPPMPMGSIRYAWPQAAISIAPTVHWGLPQIIFTQEYDRFLYVLLSLGSRRVRQENGKTHQVRQMHGVSAMVHALRGMLSGVLQNPHVLINLPTRTTVDARVTLTIVRIAHLHTHFEIDGASLQFALDFAIRATRAIALFEIVRSVFPEQALFRTRHENAEATMLRMQISEFLDSARGRVTFVKQFWRQNVV